MPKPSPRAPFLSSIILAVSVFAALTLAAPALAAQDTGRILYLSGGMEFSPDAFIAGKKAREASPGQAKRIQHEILDSKLFASSAEYAQAIRKAAQDSKLSVIILNPAAKGSAAAFLSLKEARPELRCVAINPQEDDLLIEAAADLIISSDVVSRAYRLARIAKQFGLTRMIFLPGNSGFSSDADRRFQAVLSAACLDFGLEYLAKPAKSETASFLQEEGAKGKSLLWASSLPPALALSQYLKAGNYLIESPAPSLQPDFSALLSIGAVNDREDYPKLLKRFEKAAIDSGFAGRIGTWIYPEAYALGSGVLSFLQKPAGKKITSASMREALEEIGKFCPGTKPQLSQKIDAVSGLRAKNHYYFRQDSYILGRGFFSVPPQDIPGKYQLLAY